MFTATGVTTLIVTGADVADIPLAVATAVNWYEPAAMMFPVTLNGDTVALPSDVVPAKYSTWVTVPPLTLASALRAKLTGAAKTAPLVGVVRVTAGGSGRR